jgi:hypothetical protein
VRKKILDPYKVLDPEKHDLSSKGRLTKKIFFLLFLVLLRKNEQTPGDSHSKSNFRLKSTHPTVDMSVIS